MSYREEGSSAWAVVETASSNGDSSSFDESSHESWKFGVPKDSGGATGLIVDFPTLCRVTPSYPCPSPTVSLAGAGPSSINFNIDDVLTSPGSPSQEVNCAGKGEADAAGGGGVKVTFVKGDNSYRVEPLGGPAGSTALTQSAESDPDCPGTNTDSDPRRLVPGTPAVRQCAGVAELRRWQERADSGRRVRQVFGDRDSGLAVAGQRAPGGLRHGRQFQRALRRH